MKKKILLQVGSTSKQIDYLDQNKLRDWAHPLLAEHEDVEYQLDELFGELRLSEKKPEILVFKKLEQIIN